MTSHRWHPIAFYLYIDDIPSYLLMASPSHGMTYFRYPTRCLYMTAWTPRGQLHQYVLPFDQCIMWVLRASIVALRYRSSNGMGTHDMKIELSFVQKLYVVVSCNFWFQRQDVWFGAFYLACMQLSHIPHAFFSSFRNENMHCSSIRHCHSDILHLWSVNSGDLGCVCFLDGVEPFHSTPLSRNRSIPVFGLDKKLSWNRSIPVFGFGMGWEWNGMELF
jgi:hypothetical protein